MGRIRAITIAAAAVGAALGPAAHGAAQRRLIGSSSEGDPTKLTTDGKTVYFLDFGTVSGSCPDGRSVRERLLPDLQTMIPLGSDGSFAGTAAVDHGLDLSGTQQIQLSGRIDSRGRATGVATLVDPSCPGLPAIAWHLAPPPPRLRARPRGTYHGLTAAHGAVSLHVSRDGQRLLGLRFGSAPAACADRGAEIRRYVETTKLPAFRSVRLHRGHASVFVDGIGEQASLEVNLRRDGTADGTIGFFYNTSSGLCDTGDIPWRAHR